MARLRRLSRIQANAFRPPAVPHLRTTPASALRSSPFLPPIFSTVPCLPTAALEAATAQVAALQIKRNEERARADRAEAVSHERQKSIETLKDQIAQVRVDKDAEIARLVAVRTGAG